MHTQAGKEMTMGDMTHGGRAADPAITIIVGGSRAEQRRGQAEREGGDDDATTYQTHRTRPSPLPLD